MSRPLEAQTPRVPAEAFAEESANASIVPLSRGGDKELSTLRAKLALTGHAVHELASGGFLVVDTRWAGLCKECPDLRALASFAKLVGAHR